MACSTGVSAVNTGKMPVLRESPPINISVVIERDGVVLREAVEDSAQLAEHEGVVGVIFGGGVGAA